LHERKFIGIALKKEYFDDTKKNFAEVREVLILKNYRNVKSSRQSTNKWQ